MERGLTSWPGVGTVGLLNLHLETSKRGEVILTFCTRPYPYWSFLIWEWYHYSPSNERETTKVLSLISDLTDKIYSLFLVISLFSDIVLRRIDTVCNTGLTFIWPFLLLISSLRTDILEILIRWITVRTG